MIEIFKSRHIIGWRRNSNLIGHPDFIFPKHRVVVFADGCFWHGHNCRNITPSENAKYWQNKIKRNRARDKAITRELRQKDWKVVRIWECEIKKGKVKKLLTAISTIENLEKRARRGNHERFLEILNKIPDVELEEFDKS